MFEDFVGLGTFEVTRAGTIRKAASDYKQFYGDCPLLAHVKRYTSRHSGVDVPYKAKARELRLERLSEIPRVWRNMDAVMIARIVLGMSEAEAKAIVDAADRRDDPKRPALMEALGVRQPEAVV